MQQLLLQAFWLTHEINMLCAPLRTVLPLMVLKSFNRSRLLHAAYLYCIDTQHHLWFQHLNDQPDLSSNVVQYIV